jgi:hypothetical protein
MTSQRFAYVYETRRLALLVALTMALLHARVLHAGSGTLWRECDTACPTSNCTDSCFVDGIAFEDGDSITCLDYGTYDTSQTCCGDSFCDVADGENCTNCLEDCPGPCSTGDCEPWRQTDCPTGQACASNGVCVSIPNCDSGGCNNDNVKTPTCLDAYCNNGHDSCCPGDVCEGWTYYIPVGICVPQTGQPPGVPTSRPK